MTETGGGVLGLVSEHIAESFIATQRLWQNLEHHKTVLVMAGLIVDAFKAGNKLLICGNGGSAADAQHLAAEFVGRFRDDRPALPAIALTTDSSILTAIGNDYGFDHVFMRQIEALARRGDVLLLISTSGRSKNVVAVLAWAKANGVVTLALTAGDGGDLGRWCDHALVIGTADTAIAQQLHITAGHAICIAVEALMAGGEA